MKKIKLQFEKDYVIEVNSGVSCYEVVKNYNLEKDVPVVLARVNGKLCELSSIIEEDSTFNIVDIKDKFGMMTYIRTLQFVLIKSTLELFKDAQITIGHSLSKGLFGEIYKKSKLDIDDIYLIKEKMKEIIEKDIKINKKCFQKGEAIEIFKNYGMNDKVRLLSSIDLEKVNLYELDGQYDYFYGPMAYSTGVLKIFDLIYYDPGYILRFPTSEEPFKIPKFEEHKKLAKVFYEAEKWGGTINIEDVGALNKIIDNGDIVNLIRVSEAQQEKKIAYIADKISENKSINLVLVAGPSSSGKTTFSKRLGIQLSVNGLIPIPISLDDYFVDREDTPMDEFGEYDFESIYAVDLELFNNHLQILLSGGEVEVPNYNFKTGKREWNGHKMKLPNKGILIVEGIHGLNEILTSSIIKDRKFKIYISPLTQLNLDDHNRIATTDVRMIRRIVRDFLSRGYRVEDTLKMWPSIRRGEEKNIFVFQEDADVMFNSALIYELAILKKYALTELHKVHPDSTVYDEARRLISFLNFFKEVDKELVPSNSLMREFIGGSCFYQY
ncbi:nucleoside kinase [Clostridium sp. UBA6640]|uniref:nucleoside kinase n=1 Tax=Clostridium sp. UBA6640 TaxID=1946370 RepID=UPI0025C58553|nr:nucleoside kinase [Clostridium sp. UBA6640]